MTPKQKIYYDIYEMLLPVLRSIQMQSAWRRIRYGSIYSELELVHNMHRLIVLEEFTTYDIDWLNTQALTFYKAKRRNGMYKYVIECITKMFQLVPDSLKDELKWQGPENTDRYSK